MAFMLHCAKCTLIAHKVNVRGMMTDPEGWATVTISGAPIRNMRLCPTCTRIVRDAVAPVLPELAVVDA